MVYICTLDNRPPAGAVLGVRVQVHFPATLAPRRRRLGGARLLVLAARVREPRDVPRRHVVAALQARARGPRPGRLQERSDGGVGDVERCQAAAVGEDDVRPLLEQEAHRRVGRVVRRLMQGRPADGVRRGVSWSIYSIMVCI